MKNKLILLSIISASSLLLVNCAGTSKPSLGDKISSEADAVADIGKQWQKGEDMIKKGEKMKRKGKKEIEKGDDMIKSGKKLKMKAEKSYKAKPANTALSAS